MTTSGAEIYQHEKTGRYLARIGAISHTGHTIQEIDGLFSVVSILHQGSVFPFNAKKEAAEWHIFDEWHQFSLRHRPCTSRDVDGFYDRLSFEQKVATSRLRNYLAEAALRPLLRVGDRIRATKAECGAREATFTFSHWEGGWIVSTGTASIAPGSVYSINGKVFLV